MNSPRISFLLFFMIVVGWTGLNAAGDAPDPSRDGAAVPFVTHEAEDPSNRTTGQVVKLTSRPQPGEMSPELEASDRGYVELSAPGQYLEFPHVENANALVIRHCLPDAPQGGGLSATLSLYVNGVKRQTLSLSSFHNWLYGQPGANGQSNDPSAGPPHDFWDESKFFIAGGVKPGDMIRLQKDPGDTASFYRIDLIELENVPGPLPCPPTGTSLSVTDFGAIGDGKTDNASAFAACIAAAGQQRKIIWIPPGNYCLGERLKLDGVVVQGAGMWFTNLVGTAIGQGWGGAMGFVLAGRGPQLRDLSIDSAVHSSRSENGGRAITGNPVDWLVENVWITHTVTGFWMSGAQHGIIRDCRVRSTYADGINLNGGSSENLVENCSVRGTGDDGIALLSEKAAPRLPSIHNVLRHNSVTAVWWGANCDLAGGAGHVVEQNYWADNAGAECFTINLTHSFPMYPLTDSVIRHNTILRGGGNLFGQKRGAAWFLADGTTISNVTFDDNKIVDALFRGIHLTGRSSQQMTFRHNLIFHSDGDGIFIDREVTGLGIFAGNSVIGLNPGMLAFHNTSPTYRAMQTP